MSDFFTIMIFLNFISQIADMTNDFGMSFKEVKPGIFLMGSLPYEEKTHYDFSEKKLIHIDNIYFIQITEVTQGQWKKIMGENPAHFSNFGDDYPVESISLIQIDIFLQKLNRLTIGKGYYYRLPNEAEWEYACRAGTSTPFSTGECLSTDFANFNGEIEYLGCPKGIYRHQTVKIMSYLPNDWGIFDMHGNVWEWCQDCYKIDTSSRFNDCSNFIIKGGGFADSVKFCRSGSRFFGKKTNKALDVGFRLVAESVVSVDARERIP